MISHHDAMRDNKGPRTMNIDLTPGELARIIMLLEAGGAMSDSLDKAIHYKVSKVLENFKPEGYVADPVDAAKKWQSPIQESRPKHDS